MKERLRILFVEDGLVDQMAFKRFIKREKLPYDCEICESISAARKALRAEPFDIVLTDHSLGDGTAFDLFGDIGDIPFIIITGSGNEEIAVKAMNAGAADYLIKNPDSNYFITLPSTIINALEHKQSKTELIHYREHLEELVKERTDELTRTNEQLKGEITGRMQAEETLCESEEKFRLLAENSIECIWMLDTKLRFTYLSPSLERITGFKPEQWVGTKLSSHFNKKEFLKVGAIAAKATTNYKTSTHVTFETKMLNSKNEEVDVEISSKVLLNSRGKLTGLQGTTKDITERKQAEQEIEMLLELSHQASTETNPDNLLFFITDQIVKVIPSAEASSIFLHDEKRKVVRVQAWAGFNDNEIKDIEFPIDDSQIGKIFQSKKPSLINNTSEDPDFKLIDKPSLKTTKSQMAVPLIYKKRVIGIIYADNLTRTDAFSQQNLNLLESIGNQLSGVIENARLLDQMKENHKQLSQSEKLYQSVVEDSPGLICRFKPGGILTFVNGAYCKFFGKSFEKLVGTNITSTIPDEDKEFVISNIASLNEESSILIQENKVVTPGGDIFWMRWTNRALFDDKGQVISYQSFGKDITASKQAEEKERQHYKNITFLSKTAMQFVDFPPEEDIYRFIGEQLKELAGESIVVVNSIDQTKGILTTRIVAGMEKYTKGITKLIGRNPEGMEYDANDENLAYLTDGELHDRKGGLYRIFRGAVPKPACRAIEKLFHLNKIYIIGFVQHARVFGNAIIFLPRSIELESVETIKLFIEQASIAIQRRQAEQALHQEQEKAQKYLDIAEVMIMALNKEGEITLVNQKGAGILGYQIEDLTGKNWHITCVPAADRKQTKKLFDEFMVGGAGLGNHFIQTVLTKSGENRIIDWHSTPLWKWDAEEKHRVGSLSSGEDITERVRMEQAMIVISDTQKQIAYQNKRMEIYKLVGEKVQELIGDGYVITTILDEQIEGIKVIGVNGFGDRYEKLVRKLKTDPFKTTYKLKDMSVNHLSLFSNGNLEKYKGDLFDLLTKKVPKQICKIIEKEFNVTDIYVIGFTWHDLDSGGVTILSKGDIAPFKDMIETIINQAAIAIKRIRSEEELLKSKQQLRNALEGTIHTIAATVETRDPYTAVHQKRVADLAAAIAIEMKLTDKQVEGIKMAGIIHDLGKINVPAEILSKPGELSDLEFQIIKTHPQIGFDLLKNIEFPWPIAQMVLQHHEKMDGSGYPQGFKGEEILLEARILTVADIVEAMSSHRPYRPALGIEKALNQIKKDKGTLLDPDVVDTCLKIFKKGYKLPEN